MSFNELIRLSISLLFSTLLNHCWTVCVWEDFHHVDMHEYAFTRWRNNNFLLTWGILGSHRSENLWVICTRVQKLSREEKDQITYTMFPHPCLKDMLRIFIHAAGDKVIPRSDLSFQLNFHFNTEILMFIILTHSSIKSSRFLPAIFKARGSARKILWNILACFHNNFWSLQSLNIWSGCKRSKESPGRTVMKKCIQ